jgi:G3E family GTPase
MSTTQGPISTYLVSGFLGAGKTTFIREQLKRTGARVAVLVNEFGELGVDGTLIRSVGGIDVIELPGGCICCSQREGLEESILRIAAQLRPELLLIEPSGIAESSELVKVLTGATLSGVIRLDAAITVIDAETFLEFSAPDAFGAFFLDQVMNADLILVNKSDLVGEEELAAIGRRVEALRPGGVLLNTEFCRMEGSIPTGGRERAPFSCGGPFGGMECVSLVPGTSISGDELETFLAGLADGRYGWIARGKGFLRVQGQGFLNLQIVAGRVTIEPFTGEASPRLTLIGSGLERERVRAFFSAAG